MALILFPTFALTKGKDSAMMAILIMGIMGMSICVALTWLPYWILLMLAMLVAFLYADKIKGTFGK
jgi:hypothetical protein